MRSFVFTSLLLLFALSLGCGGTKELKPDDSQVEPVSQEEIQQKIKEGMQKSGDIKQSKMQN